MKTRVFAIITVAIMICCTVITFADDQSVSEKNGIPYIEFYADRIVRIRDGKVISDEINHNAEGLDYRIENRIYLKDIKDRREFGDENHKVRVFNESGGKMDIDIVISRGNLFIQSRDPSSRMELVDEN